MKNLSRLLATGAAAVAILVGFLLTAPAASAAPGVASTSSSDVTPMYATMLVEAGAAARTGPWLSGTFVGWVTADPGSAYQVSWVDCYQDGDWATGNYSSNRWFHAYVYHTGSSVAEWRFVHSSFVTNQSGVPSCW